MAKREDMEKGKDVPDYHGTGVLKLVQLLPATIRIRSVQVNFWGLDPLRRALLSQLCDGSGSGSGRERAQERNSKR